MDLPFCVTANGFEFHCILLCDSTHSTQIVGGGRTGPPPTICVPISLTVLQNPSHVTSQSGIFSVRIPLPWLVPGLRVSAFQDASSERDGLRVAIGFALPTVYHPKGMKIKFSPFLKEIRGKMGGAEQWRQEIKLCRRSISGALFHIISIYAHTRIRLQAVYLQRNVQSGRA